MSGIDPTKRTILISCISTPLRLSLPLASNPLLQSTEIAYTGISGLSTIIFIKDDLTSTATSAGMPAIHSGVELPQILHAVSSRRDTQRSLPPFPGAFSRPPCSLCSPFPGPRRLSSERAAASLT